MCAFCRETIVFWLHFFGLEGKNLDYWVGFAEVLRRDGFTSRQVEILYCAWQYCSFASTISGQSLIQMKNQIYQPHISKHQEMLAISLMTIIVWVAKSDFQFFKFRVLHSFTFEASKARSFRTCIIFRPLHYQSKKQDQQ